MKLETTIGEFKKIIDFLNYGIQEGYKVEERFMTGQVVTDPGSLPDQILRKAYMHLDEEIDGEVKKASLERGDIPFGCNNQFEKKLQRYFFE